MKPETEALLVAFEKAPLLSTAGQSLNDRSVARIESLDFFKSKDELTAALDFFSVDRWNDVYVATSPEDWEDIMEDVEYLNVFNFKRIKRIEEGLMGHPVQVKQNPRWVASIIGECLNHACNEIEFREYSDSKFFSEIAVPWILKGRLPCGWEGEYPKGKLRVF